MYNYCIAESATVTIEPAEDKLDKKPHAPIPARHQGTNKCITQWQQSIIASNSLSVKFYICDSKHSILYVLSPLLHSSFLLVLGCQCYVNWRGCRSRPWCVNWCLEKVHLKEKRKKNTIRSRLNIYNRDDATSTWLTNLAADSQQRVQNQYGRNRCHSNHLGVVADNGPEGEDQD